ncbi:hypothetical protein PNA2_1333 [Pyrococcus sp. NA2]|uniref:nucleotidyltransferase n=1 Tax=Pyrococcus sp. (strain NA2) TaxID=342949 RepID=UPI000209ADFC|nr:nucleotidyltransferase [Pyrococcus sp. NA2]AEC52248.1 hypothetical protein PNA2_1333 [Pyrococcus sp. NA2]
MQTEAWALKIARAIRDYLKDSDYDIIVVSEAFKGKHFTERSSEVLRVLLSSGVIGDFEILCYTPEEFERKKKACGIVREALREGIIIA